MKIYKHKNFSYITIVEIPKEEIQMVDMDLCAQPRQTLSDYYNSCAIKPTIICNGGFFSMTDGDTVFTYKDDGEVINYLEPFTVGMGTINGQLEFGEINNKNFADFISAYPVLICDYKIAPVVLAKELDYKARRTILAMNKENIYIIAVEGSGLAFRETQELLYDMGVQYAINLDGGGSTKILHNGKSLTSTWHNRAVDNVVAFYLKPVKRYKLRMCSIRNHRLALKLYEELFDLEFLSNLKLTINKITPYWRVDIGEFSKKEDAFALSKKLKKLGYNPIVVSYNLS